MSRYTNKTTGQNDADLPLVSVIIPVWNAENNIGKLIDDLFAQTYKHIEIIAIDDGSSDNSLSVLRKLAEKDPRLHVVHQKNAGVGAARNRGIELATGQYLVFIDSDDEVLPEFIESMVQTMQDNPEAILAIVGREYKKLRAGKVKQLYMHPRRARRAHETLSSYVTYLMILDGRMYGMTGRIFIADTIRKHNIRVEEGRDFAEDTKFAIDYLAAKDGKIFFIPRPLYIYNFGTETSIVHKSSLDWGGWQKSYQELKNWVSKDSGEKISFQARIRLALVYLRWRVAHYRSNRRAQE